MSNKTIHIISLDVPFPPDYGAMIDTFYRIKILHELGYSIIFHCFTYGRGKPEELKKYCKEVYYYDRKKRLIDFFALRPFIVQTRRSKLLLSRLLKDDYPIFIEGVHCCWFLEQPAIQKRLTIVRAHNIEAEYYDEMKKNASGLKRIFFWAEAKKLALYENPIISKATVVLTVKANENDFFQKYNANTLLMPSSIPEIHFEGVGTLKDYCLFHGNLSVSENDLSAKWLIEQVVPSLGGIPFVVAGKNPSPSLIKLCQENKVQLIANPDQEAMQQLIAEAKIHVLISTNSAGLKLKLFAVLQTLGTIIVNSNMIKGNGLDKYCKVANTSKEFVQLISEEFKKDVPLEERLARIEAFKQETDTKKLITETFDKIFSTEN
ncbi:MAG: hypothetical protein M9916_08865 [Crocinitomicaceae bacterium]|nr:hypothetical protein [Crocinitomicaceae bacterium]